MKLSRKLCAALFSATLLAGCEQSASIFACEQPRDWGLVSLGLPTPQPLPFDTSRLDVQAIAPFYSKGVPVIAALVGGRYADAEKYFDEVGKRATFEERYSGVWDVWQLLHERGLYFLPMMQSWLASAPDSNAAKLMLGLAYIDAATKAHGSRYASQTKPEQIALYETRQGLAMPLLDAIALRDDALGLTARSALLHTYFLSGQREAGWAVHEALLARLPLQPAGYINALEYAHPKWSGAQSEQRSTHVLELAVKNGLGAQPQKLLAQIVAAHRDDIENNSDPRAWRPYWTARTEEVPGEFNLRHWLYKEMSVENWNVVVKLAQRIIDLRPGDAKAHFQKAWALQHLGKNEEAFNAMVSAAVVGSDAAMGQIVYAYVKGTYGRKQQDFGTMYEYCKFGAALGLPSAANCMASSYTDGFGGVKRDDAMAVSWHLLAARGGEVNSMHDLGVLLPRVVPGADGQAAAAYWMRKAADAKHVYALKKVGMQPQSDSSLGCRIGNKPAEFVDLMLRIDAFFRAV